MTLYDLLYDPRDQYIISLIVRKFLEKPENQGSAIMGEKSKLAQFPNDVG
jgi:hypothetical protein